jgi:hypothetical protein
MTSVPETNTHEVMRYMAQVRAAYMMMGFSGRMASRWFNDGLVTSHELNASLSLSLSLPVPPST